MAVSLERIKQLRASQNTIQEFEAAKTASKVPANPQPKINSVADFRKLDEASNKVQPTQTALQTAEYEQWYKDHPVLNALAHNPVSNFLNKMGEKNDVFGEGLRGAIIGQKPSEAITTGNPTEDKALHGLGTVASFFLPGTVGSGAPLIRGGSQYVADAVIPVTKSLASKAGNKALTGALESVPYTMQQLMQEHTDNPVEVAKTVGVNALFGGGTELAISGIGGALSKLKKKPAPITNEPARNAAESMQPIGGKLPKSEPKPIGGKDSINTGDAIWKNKDFDQPVKVTGYAGEYNGKKYVNIEGSNAAIPFDEIEFSPLGGKLPKTEPKPIGGESPKPANKVVLNAPKNKFSFKKAWDSFYRNIVDTQAPIQKADERAGMLASNSRNAGGTVDYILRDGLVDRQGNKIGKSLREVAEQIPKGKEEEFWTYMAQRHNIDRAREGKNVIPNYTSEMSERAVKEIEAVNPGFKTAGDEVTNWIDKFMREWGVNAGTVDKDVYEQLRQTYKSYFPTQREFSQLEKSMPEGVRKQFVDNISPIRTATGSERDINYPLENIMNLVNRTVRTARYNEVGQSLLNSVKQAPEKLKEFAEVIPAQEGMFANTDNVISVLENGKPVYLRINNKELLDALKGLPKVVNNAKVMRAVTNVFKGLITQKNPLFAIRNIFRDIPTAYIYGGESNPFKFAGRLGRAMKDIATNSERYQRYRAVGGGGANFFKGDAESAVKNLSKGGFHPLKAIENFNNMTETAPRLAEFNRVFDETGDVQKALAAANDITVNFARGGNVTKAAEPFVPYLNAGVQGLDKLFRTFKNPKTAIAALVRGGIAITAPEIALYLINKDDPNYQALDNRTKDNYYLIGKGDGTFWKIPKSRELGVLFGSLFQRVLRAQAGEKDAWKGFAGTVGTNFMPNNPVENNIGAPLLINLATNKDFAGRSIVPQGMVMDKRSPYLQYDERTTEIAKAIGEYSKDIVEGGISPKQIDYLIKSYTGVIGQLGIPAATKGGDPLKTILMQFTADPLYSSQVLTDFYDNYDRLQRAATDKNITEQLPTSGKKNVVTPEEELRNKFKKASEQISDLNKQIRQIEAALTPDKEARVRELRRQIQDIAKAANALIQ